jgi:hypothetical protein
MDKQKKEKIEKKLAQEVGDAQGQIFQASLRQEPVTQQKEAVSE